ncbi:conserved hypothetical protein [Talaromyces stipitatus ATCC 10500]|uniref:Uncharacterized protein n=1 Tax=Talaromyces stipitatus (strain ATCC 10500 / CBS 375.48 / QM 6759 / NRRL 1006) TaxID=441959 RepID=B8MT57_TALSN|nr:uncharacterized protein TSTA_003220 [Talaromyces stipitatus ATCC 10500]EED12260.1 conserved hypothetical protein [Talaromyces stipitatus ATCC 10500]
MPSNTYSERNDAAGSSSKTSLLWAYQLRREHVHLVDRIDDMNNQLLSCSDKSQACGQHLSNLESLVKSLQAENYTLKNEVTLVRTKLTARIEDINQQIASFLGSDNAVKDVTKQLELEFRGMGLQLAELSESVSELRGEITNIAKRKQPERTQHVHVESTQDNTGLAKVESGTEVTVARPKCVVRLFYGKKKPTQLIPEPVASTANLSESMVDLDALSTLTDSIIPDSMPPPNPVPRQYDFIFCQIHQNGRTINDYFAFVSQLRSQLPRRKQEGHIVEAFFDGIAEDSEDGHAFKASLKDYLDKVGWVWSHLELFFKPCALRNKKRALYNTRARLRANALAAKQKAQLEENSDLQG